MSAKIYAGQVPGLWAGVGHLSQKPLMSWQKDLNDRITFLKTWVKEGTPSVFWMSGFFFPQGFMSGLLQNFARRHHVAIDLVVFNFDVMDHLDASEARTIRPPKDGCYVHGIFLEGCRYTKDAHALEPSRPKELFTEMPMIWFVPSTERQVSTDLSKHYACPLYKVLSRSGTLSTTGHSTNFVIFVDLPTKEHPDVWVKAGVALFLALRD